MAPSVDAESAIVNALFLDVLQSAVVAVSALVNALYETNMVAIVRRVYQANGTVRLGCLIPNIKKDYEVSIFYSDHRLSCFGFLHFLAGN